MFSFIKSLAALFSFSANLEQDRDDRYLAESADMHDLERRMRQIDAGRVHPYAIGTHGIFLR